MEKIHENMHFYEKFKHESTKTYMYFSFSAYLYPPPPPPPLQHNGKGSIPRLVP